MRAAAVAGFRNLGFTTTSYSGAAFTRAHVLARTVADWGYYVHSPRRPLLATRDGKRYAGFKEDAGLCIGREDRLLEGDRGGARRAQKSNLVIMSTCHLGESRDHDAGRLRHPEGEGGQRAPGRGPTSTSGTWARPGTATSSPSRPRFWNALGPGLGVGAGLRRGEARRRSTRGSPPTGTAATTGRGGPGPCRRAAPSVCEVMTMHASLRAPLGRRRTRLLVARCRGRGRDRAGLPGRNGARRRGRPLRRRRTRHGAGAAPPRSGRSGPGSGGHVPQAPRPPGAGRRRRRPA